MLNPQLWIAVFIDGSFFALLALAFYITLVGSQFFNFAIGPYSMAAGMATSWLVVNHGWGIWLSAGVGIVVVLILGAVTDIAVIRPIQSRAGGGDLPALVAVAALLFAIQQTAGLIFGFNNLPGEPIVSTNLFTLDGAQVEPTVVPLVVACGVIFLLTALWIGLTRTGRLLRAVGDSPQSARLLGFRVNRIRLIAFMLSALIAALAGLLFASTSGNGIGFESGLQWTLDGFLALVIGGIGWIWAPLVGGFLLAMAQIFVPYYLGGSSVDYIVLLLAVVFFAFRPQGLFAHRVRV